MEDREIIKLYLDRNEKAITETNKKYNRFCYCISYNILRNIEDADEAVNDTYLGAWNSIPPNIPESLCAFLGKIARNVCLKRLRTVNAKKRGNGEINLIFDEISDSVSQTHSVENEIEAKELSEFINRFLHSLPDTERRLFIRRYWYFDTVSELSEKFGFSESKVKSMLFRTRNKLRSRLEEEKLI